MNESPALRELLKSNLTIPTIPDVVLRINRLMQSPDCGTREIGAVVAEDAPLAAKVLRIANSAYYGLTKECMSTEHASTILGMRVLKNIVTQVSVINQFDHIQKETGYDVSRIWRHAILTAQLCSRMAPKARAVRILSPDEFYVCGLLHDVGKVVLLDGLGRKYVDVLTSAEASGLPVEQVEQQQLGFDHQDVGAVVGNRWGLPDALIDAIQRHHAPAQEIGPRLHVVLVAACNKVAHCVDTGDREGAARVLAEAARALDLDASLIEGFVDFAFTNADVDI